MKNNRVQVLFVCTGNICRSSMAEGLFRHALLEAGLEKSVSCDSAGLIDYHEGHPPDSRACTHMATLGIDIRGQKSTPVRPEQLSECDYIIAMDTGHLKALQQMRTESMRSRIQLMMDYADNAKGRSVPDPYYSDDSAFVDVAKMLQPAIHGLLQEIRAVLQAQTHS